jgi:hypothetical protein
MKGWQIASLMTKIILRIPVMIHGLLVLAVKAQQQRTLFHRPLVVT